MEVVSPRDGDVMKCKVTLADVLVFITGAPAVPPIGFVPHPSIQFKSVEYPSSNTCTNCFYLPVIKMTYDHFKYNALYGILNSYGFGQV